MPAPTTLQIAEFTLRLRLEAFKDLRNPSDEQVAQAVDTTVDLFDGGFADEWNVESAVFTALDVLDGIVSEGFEAPTPAVDYSYVHFVDGTCGRI
jgi:hypothetical protein